MEENAINRINFNSNSFVYVANTQQEITETCSLFPKSHEFTAIRSRQCNRKMFSFIQKPHESAITVKQRGQVTFCATVQIFQTYKQKNNFL